jgi:pteridine reductase
MSARPRRGKALITGAGIRVGRAIARALAAAGYDLLLHAHSSRSGVEETAGEVEALGARATLFSADLSRVEEVERLAAEVAEATESLDVLVHNAAIYQQAPFASIDREAYRRMLAINLDAPFFLTQALLPLLEAGRSPVVIHIGDIGGVDAEPGYAHYSVSKAGLLMLTRALAVELAPTIRVNSVSPGTVAFPEDFGFEAKERILSRIPLGREGTVDDIASAVVFLAKDAPYMTGQDLKVDGGRSVLL